MARPKNCFGSCTHISNRKNKQVVHMGRWCVFSFINVVLLPVVGNVAVAYFLCIEFAVAGLFLLLFPGDVGRMGFDLGGILG